MITIFFPPIWRKEYYSVYKNYQTWLVCHSVKADRNSYGYRKNILDIVSADLAYIVLDKYCVIAVESAHVNRYVDFAPL